MRVKISLRHVPGRVRAIDARRREPRPVRRLEQAFRDPGRHLPVAHGPIVGYHMGPVETGVDGVFVGGPVGRADFVRQLPFERRIVGVPGAGVLVAHESTRVVRVGMKNFSRAQCAIPIIAKIPGDRRQVGQVFVVEPTGIVFVNARAGRAQAQHQRGSRRIADSGDRVGVGKHHAASGKCVDIRGLCLGMPPEDTDPVVQVVDRDEQDIGTVCILCLNARCRREKQKRGHK